MDTLENEVMKEIFKVANNNEALINAINKYKLNLENEPSSIFDIKNLSTQISTKQLQVKNLVDKIGINFNIYDSLATRIEELNNEIKALKSKKLKIENSQINIKESLKKVHTYTTMLLHFEDLFNNSDYQMKRLFVNSLVDKIFYDSKTKTAEIKLFCNKALSRK